MQKQFVKEAKVEEEGGGSRRIINTGSRMRRKESRTRTPSRRRARRRKSWRKPKRKKKTNNQTSRPAASVIGIHSCTFCSKHEHCPLHKALTPSTYQVCSTTWFRSQLFYHDAAPRFPLRFCASVPYRRSAELDLELGAFCRHALRQI